MKKDASSAECAVIRSYVRSSDPIELQQHMGAGVSDIAEIMPEIRDALPNVKAAPKIQSDEARFRLLNSIKSFLIQASISHPQLIVLDNLQLADRSSLLQLELMAEEIAETRILIVGTWKISTHRNVMSTPRSWHAILRLPFRTTLLQRQ